VPKPFDLLGQFGIFGVERKISLRDPEAKRAFGIHVGQAVDRALADPTLLHGQRTEAMFEALLVSLGDFCLLKAEDNGRVFPTGDFAAPDFRVVLQDGSQWLIEVKNVYEDDPFHQERQLLNRVYHQKLAAYAAATQAELKLAVFWARWSIWTLVSPGRLALGAGDLTLDMMTAMQVNELGRLGDMLIGTRAPLGLRLATNPVRSGRIGTDGLVEVVLGDFQIFSEDREIVDSVEREIAWIFIQYGQWVGLEPEPVIEGDRLLALQFRWEPPKSSEQGFDDQGFDDQGFDWVGSLSRVFARYYAEQTIKDHAIDQLRAPLRPGWFSPLIRRGDLETQALPLWRMTLLPNYSGLREQR
jgi:hypothetical protein